MRDEVATILISAHPDDVALSVGGSILAGYFKRPLLIVSVFSWGGTAPLYSGSHDLETLYKLMVREDEAFAGAVGCGLVDLDMTDVALDSTLGEHFKPLRWLSCLLRGPPPPNDMELERGLTRLSAKVPRSMKWSLMKSMVGLEGAYHSLKERLWELVSKHPDASLASPLSLGLHPDHVLVTCACKNLIPPDRIIYYEDLPYSMTYNLRGIARHVRSFDRNLRPTLIDIEGVMTPKLRNLGFYESQLAPIDIARVAKHARRLGSGGRAYERIWTSGRSSGIRKEVQRTMSYSLKR